MSITSGATFEDLTVAVGELLGAVETGTATGGSSTTLVDTALRGGDESKTGKYYRLTSGSDDGVQRQASGYVQTTTTVTVVPAWATGASNGVTYEEWDGVFNPVAVRRAINQAVRDATGKIFDAKEDITLHTGGTVRYDIPSPFAALYSDAPVALRTWMESRIVLPGGQAWNESIQADWTVTQDVKDELFGRFPTKLAVAGTASNGDVASQAISALDISGYDFIEFPIKVNVAVASGDLILRLSATPNGADTDKLITIPAIPAETDTWVRVPMSESASGFVPSECTAIISIALEYNANVTANTIWIGEIEATLEDSYAFTPVRRDLWTVNKQGRDLVFSPSLFRRGAVWHNFTGHQSTNHHIIHDIDSLGYRLIRLRGGDNPLLMTSDADVNEIPDSYVINQAAGHLLSRPVPGETREQASIRQADAGAKYALARVAESLFPLYKNKVDIT